MVSYVQSHYGNRIDTDDLANEYHQNRTEIFALFKSETGYTFSDYITRYRMFIAKYILAFTEVTIHDTALQVGYGDQAHFSRVFKKYVGVPPEDFRRTAVEARKANLNKKTTVPRYGNTRGRLYTINA